MIKFFRKIRQKLLTENRFSRYLIYALGEILLVVIGILIALQINNWNEWRKDRIVEKGALEDVYRDLESNYEALSRLILLNNQNNQSANKIISLIHNRNNSLDSLSIHLHRGRFDPAFGLFLSDAGYESLKNTGFNILRNDTLKNMILNLYEVVYPQILNFIQTVEAVSINGSSLIDEHFITEDGGLLTPINLDVALSDVRYFVFLKRTYGLRNAINNRSKRCQIETTKVLQLIKDELGESDAK